MDQDRPPQSTKPADSAPSSASGSRRRRRRNGKTSSPKTDASKKSEGNPNRGVNTNNSPSTDSSSSSANRSGTTANNSNPNSRKPNNGRTAVVHAVCYCQCQSGHTPDQNPNPADNGSGHPKNAREKQNQQNPSTKNIPERQAKTTPPNNPTKVPSSSSNKSQTGNIPSNKAAPGPESTSDRLASLTLSNEPSDKTGTTQSNSNQKRDRPYYFPTRSERSPLRSGDRPENNQQRLTQSGPASSSRVPHPQGAYPKSGSQTDATTSAPPLPPAPPSNSRSYPPTGIPPEMTMEDAECMIKQIIPGSKITRTSPDGPLASTTVRVNLERPQTAASRINQQRREEHQNRRSRMGRKSSGNKLGKSFQALQETLPPEFMPQERTREAILQQTKSFTRMLEDKLAAAPATSMCLVCNKPRIACGCEVPEFLRQPVERLGRRFDEFMEKKCHPDNGGPRIRLRVYEEVGSDGDDEDEEEEEGEEGGDGGEEKEGKEEKRESHKGEKKKMLKEMTFGGPDPRDGRNHGDNSNSNSNDNDNKDIKNKGRNRRSKRR